MTATENKKSAHPNCSCQVRGRGKYCSAQCEAAGDAPDIDYKCEHPGSPGRIQLSPAIPRQDKANLRRLRHHRFTLAKSLRRLAMLLACALLFLLVMPEGFSGALPSSTETAVPPKVLHLEGLLHGFLVLRSLEGEVLAEGEITQVAHGDRLKITLVFHFKDTSLYQEDVVFSQHRVFRVFSYHLTQKGSAFKNPLELSLDGSAGEATVRYTNSDGKEVVESERLKLAQDLANGLITTLVKNIQPGAASMTLSMVVATPKPRVVKVVISEDGADWFSVGNSTHKAVRYAVKIELKGVPGLVAPLVGKEPPDTHIWVLHGEAPAYLKSEGPLCAGCPVWRIELVSPAWKNK